MSEVVRSVFGTLFMLRVIWLAFDKALILLFIFKAFVLLDIGETRYRATLASYQNPVASERLALLVMGLDPVTMTLRDVGAELRTLGRRSNVLAGFSWRGAKSDGAARPQTGRPFPAG